MTSNYIKVLAEHGDREDAIRAASEIVYSDDSLWQSPIERILGTSLFATGWWHGITFIYRSPGQPECFKEAYKRICADIGVAPLIIIMTQQKIGKYCADFLVTGKIGRTIKSVVVEADGHDFHQKTRAQVAKDKVRDRYMSSLGLTTIRFTGTELVTKNHFLLADEVYTIMGYK